MTPKLPSINSLFVSVRFASSVRLSLSLRGITPALLTGEVAFLHMATDTKPAAGKAASKQVKEKKVRFQVVPKEKKPVSGSKPYSPSHPTYFQMIKEAILALKEKSGSSPHAIAKHMEEKHKAFLSANYKKLLTVQLRNCVAKGKLIKVKSSFKLSETSKKDAVKKPVVAVKEKKAKALPSGPVKAKAKAKAANDAKKKKRKADGAVSKPNKSKLVAKTKLLKSIKSPETKKSMKAAPAKPKQPKSIKSPVVKKARKVAA